MGAAKKSVKANQKEIPLHQLDPLEYFFLEKIETINPEAFEYVHRHDFYEMLWFTESEENGCHEIDFESYHLEANQIYILSPDQVHRMRIGNKKGYLIALPKVFFDSLELAERMLVFPYFFKCLLDQQTIEVLAQLICLIEKEYFGQKRKSLLETYFKAFFIHIVALGAEPVQKGTEKTAQLMQLIERFYKTQKDVLFYTQILNLSERRVNEIMMAQGRKTIKQLVIERTITEAKRLIGFGEYSIKEIAFELGYHDPAYFSRLFKNRTGLTPENFRRIEKSFK